jgi:hypothetical protein
MGARFAWRGARIKREAWLGMSPQENRYALAGIHRRQSA